jgi:hypothetical protein
MKVSSGARNRWCRRPQAAAEEVDGGEFVAVTGLAPAGVGLWDGSDNYSSIFCCGRGCCRNFFWTWLRGGGGRASIRYLALHNGIDQSQKLLDWPKR